MRKGRKKNWEKIVDKNQDGTTMNPTTINTNNNQNGNNPNSLN